MPTRDPGDPTDPTGRSGRNVATLPPPPAAASPSAAPAPYRPPAPAPATSTPTWQSSARGAGGWASWNDVPTGEQNQLVALADLWEQSIGFQVTLGAPDLLALANANVQTQRDLGQFAATTWGARFGSVLGVMPWATYGLGKDEYASASHIYTTEYKKLTGQEITADALHQAFQNPRDPTGGLLSAGQYTQQLMNDANVQKTYGWVKYGLDFSQWTQQKLQFRGVYGRDIQDAEAQTLLQYNKTAAGANLTAQARATTKEPTVGQVGVGGSVTR